MQSILRFGAAVSLLMQVISVSAATPVQALSKHLSSFQGMKADFQQTLITDKRAPSRKASGKMFILRPGKFRWEVEKPNQQTIVTDGKELWIYDVDLEQATRKKLDTSNENSPAVFLSGNASQIPRRFTVSELQKQPGDWFKLKAKSDQDMFQEVVLHFNERRLQSMEVVTRLGQRSRFAFSNIKLDPKFTVSSFNFKPPRGTDVIENR